MKEPVWVDKQALVLLHSIELARFGGAEGMRNEAQLELALAKPPNAFRNGQAEITSLAALYVSGLIKTHPFVDGNKLLSFMVMALFLSLNGWSLKSDVVGAIQAITALDRDKINENQFAAWLKLNVKRD
jgi:death-on-curing protein